MWKKNPNAIQNGEREKVYLYRGIKKNEISNRGSGGYKSKEMM